MRAESNRSTQHVHGDNEEVLRDSRSLVLVVIDRRASSVEMTMSFAPASLA